MSKIKRVLIAGGTHGNELNGVYAIRKYKRCPELVRRQSFETFTVLGNPKAIEAGTRYIDKDLNRCFDAQEQKTTALEYEIQRAKEIKNQFGQAGQMPVDLAIDQHGTDSNAGLMLILDNLDCLTLRLAAYLSYSQPELKVYCSAASGRSQDSLRSVAKYGIGIEVGPVAHGTLHAELFQKTEAVVYAILDYLEQYNSNTVSLKETSLTVYQYVDAVDYPRDENGEIQAMIHPQLQFKDYEALNPGAPMFLTFDGDAIAYQGSTTVYPIFVNEAAYYEKGIAMYLTKKQQFQVS